MPGRHHESSSGDRRRRTRNKFSQWFAGHPERLNDYRTILREPIEDVTNIYAQFSQGPHALADAFVELIKQLNERFKRDFGFHAQCWEGDFNLNLLRDAILSALLSDDKKLVALVANCPKKTQVLLCGMDPSFERLCPTVINSLVGAVAVGPEEVWQHGHARRFYSLRDYKLAIVQYDRTIICRSLSDPADDEDECDDCEEFIKDEVEEEAADCLFQTFMEGLSTLGVDPVILAMGKEAGKCVYGSVSGITYGPQNRVREELRPFVRESYFLSHASLWLDWLTSRRFNFVGEFVSCLSAAFSHLYSISKEQAEQALVSRLPDLVDCMAHGVGSDDRSQAEIIEDCRKGGVAAARAHARLVGRDPDNLEDVQFAMKQLGQKGGQRAAALRASRVASVGSVFLTDLEHHAGRMGDARADKLRKCVDKLHDLIFERVNAVCRSENVSRIMEIFISYVTNVAEAFSSSGAETERSMAVSRPMDEWVADLAKRKLSVLPDLVVIFRALYCNGPAPACGPIEPWITRGINNYPRRDGEMRALFALRDTLGNYWSVISSILQRLSPYQLLPVTFTQHFRRVINSIKFQARKGVYCDLGYGTRDPRLLIIGSRHNSKLFLLWGGNMAELKEYVRELSRNCSGLHLDESWSEDLADYVDVPVADDDLPPDVDIEDLMAQITRVLDRRAVEAQLPRSYFDQIAKKEREKEKAAVAAAAAAAAAEEEEEEEEEIEFERHCHMNRKWGPRAVLETDDEAESQGKKESENPREEEEEENGRGRRRLTAGTRRLRANLGKYEAERNKRKRK